MKIDEIAAQLHMANTEHPHGNVPGLSADIEFLIPTGWTWSLHGPNAIYQARAVLASPDYKIQIGREGPDIDAALKDALSALRDGAKG